MSIQYEKETGIFHLTTAHSSYQMQVDSYGHLLHLYYGKRTVQSAGHVLTYYDRGFCGNPGEAGMDLVPIRWMCCHRNFRPEEPEIIVQQHWRCMMRTERMDDLVNVMMSILDLETGV